jgi:phosphatidate cytidylyltransferase
MSEEVALLKPRSDLGVRTASGIVMMALAIGAIVLGGWFFTAFIVSISVGLMIEWAGLARRLSTSVLVLIFWVIVGIAYVAFAAYTLVIFYRNDPLLAVLPIAVVIVTDVGAYASGRTFGGPKIAPSISPSKTWSGLAGGMTLAALLLGVPTALMTYGMSHGRIGVFDYLQPFLLGALGAVVAQAGDFFESWMKRRAGVKDSGRLIPGHGGLLDRADGMLAVVVVLGFYALIWPGNWFAG